MWRMRISREGLIMVQNRMQFKENGLWHIPDVLLGTIVLIIIIVELGVMVCY